MEINSQRKNSEHLKVLARAKTSINDLEQIVDKKAAKVLQKNGNSSEIQHRRAPEKPISKVQRFKGQLLREKFNVVVDRIVKILLTLLTCTLVAKTYRIIAFLSQRIMFLSRAL